MTVSWRICLLTLFILFIVATPAVQAASGPFLQGVVGAGIFTSDSLTFRLPPEESGEEKDLSTMPFIGFIGQHLFAGDRTQLGVEGGILFGWRSRSSSVLVGPNQVAVKIDSSFWLLDLSAGVCLNQRLGPRWRLYLAAGPTMVFGEYDADEDVRTAEGADDPAAAAVRGGSESEFGVGGYARVGLEYEFAPQSLVGFSVRGLASNMEFDNTVESSRVRGVQAFVTFTRNFGR
jgi:hypothetical protein